MTRFLFLNCVHRATSGSTASRAAVEPHAMTRRAARREVACHNASRRPDASRHFTPRRGMPHFASRDDASHCDTSGRVARQRSRPTHVASSHADASPRVAPCQDMSHHEALLQHRVTTRSFNARRDASTAPSEVGFDGQQAGRQASRDDASHRDTSRSGVPQRVTPTRRATSRHDAPRHNTTRHGALRVTR